MTLTGLPDGFQIDYTYNPAATGDVGKYGYNFGDAKFEDTRPFEDRTFVFSSGVPEPSTWMTLLLGFGLTGFALRRKRRQLMTA